jgi:hypothetical protein
MSGSGVSGAPSIQNQSPTKSSKKKSPVVLKRSNITISQIATPSGNKNRMRFSNSKNVEVIIDADAE